MPVLELWNSTYPFAHVISFSHLTKLNEFTAFEFSNKFYFVPCL